MVEAARLDGAFDEAERNMRLFAASVLPELKKVEVSKPEFALSA